MFWVLIENAVLVVEIAAIESAKVKRNCELVNFWEQFKR